MNRTGFLRLERGERRERRERTWPGTAAPAAIGLGVFMGVAGVLFLLFLAAYAMRMDAPDWRAVRLPWQVWQSTALLAGGSLAMGLAVRAARAGQPRRAWSAWWIGGLAAAAFIASQLWGWQVLLARQVGAAGNPAGSFFYLLTAMHGLHVLGGLAGWILVTLRGTRGAGAALRLALCARYWHFLLAVWVVVLVALRWLTPEVVRFVCGGT